jgi:type I restriction enzyme S subunit
MGNLQGGKIDWNDLVFTDVPSEIGKYTLVAGDVLFNRTNTIDLVGKTSLYKGERPAIFAGYLIRIEVDKAALNSPYLNYILNAEFSKRHSSKVLSVAVGPANINSQKLKTYPIPLPPTLAEQEAIAEALSDADALIESLEQLLTKKRQIKQGAMQEFLTGKRRLPGFQSKPGYKQTEAGFIPEDWHPRSMASIASDVASGRSHFDSEFGAFSVYGSTGPFGRANKADYSGQAILIARVGANAGTLNVVDGEYGVTDNTIIVRIGDLAVLSYVWRQLEAKHLNSMVFGSGQPLITATQLKNLSIPFPPTRAEQEAIASALSDMDSALSALETKLTKARQIKQGMMQNLLTGKIRLV